ncbi:MAG TPA: C10 family peptidase, partial [Bacteroidia bacterium]|nr:C10 family peptidase [Bacteroidia bacterium]
QAWIDTLEKEFNNKRIIEYEGQESAGGHTWVCDGNDATTPYNNVHMNWGWSGYDDGFFAVTNLTPAGQGTFNTGIAALIGIQPPPGAFTGIANVSNESTVLVYPNPNNGSFTVELNNVKDKQQLTMFNMLGQSVYTTSIDEGKTQINLNQPAGIYFYRVLSTEGNLVSEGKVIVK